MLDAQRIELSMLEKICLGKSPTYIQNYIKRIEFRETNYLFIMDDNGMFYYHPRADLINTDYSKASFFIKLVKNKETKGRTGNFTYVFEGIDKTATYIYVDHKYYVETISNSILYSSIGKMKQFVSFSIFIILLISIGLFFIFEKMINRFLMNIVSHTQLAHDGDFQDIPTLSEWIQNYNEHDIFHKVSNNILSLFTRLNKYFHTTQDISKILTDSTTEITELISDINTSSEIIQVSMKTVFDVNQVNYDNTLIMKSSSDVLNSGINVMRNEIDNQSSYIEETSSAITEMIANLESINANNNQSRKNMTTLVQIVKEGVANQESLGTDINELSIKVEDLNHANTLVSDIANQTSILAMNGMIEAAHAGDVGKGFAVVAGEMGKLSKKSTIESKQISELIKDIIDIINILMTDSIQTVMKYKTMSSLVGDVDLINEEISGAIIEQTTGNEQILAAVSEMRNSSTVVTESFKDLDASYNNLNKSIEDVNNSSSNISGEIEQVIVQLRTIGDMIATVTNISGELDEITDKLNTENSYFKI